MSPVVQAELESQLMEALAAARSQLAHIRGELALVADFLTRPEH